MRNLRCLGRDDCFDTADPEFHTDVLFAQVFGRADARTVMALVGMRGEEAITLKEIRVRLTRYRERMNTGAPPVR